MSTQKASQVPAVTPAELSQQLHAILNVVDNNERRAVEAGVVQALSNPQNLIQLVNIMCDQDSCTAGVRQLAAVLLRKKVFSLWHSLQQSQQHELRSLLLQQLGKETVRPVRLAIAHIVTRLAKADALREDDGDAAGWPELYQATRAAAEDPRPEMRELAMVLVYSFSEVFFDQNTFASLAAETVIRGVSDTVVPVQTAAVKAAVMLLPALVGNTSIRNTFLEHLVPQCLRLLQELGPREDMASLCISVLDLIEGLFQDLTAKKHGEMLVTIAGGLVGVMVNAVNHPRVRENSGAALSQLVTSKPKFIVSRSLLAPLVAACMQLMSEDATISLSDPATGGNDDEGDDGDMEDDVDMLHVRPPCMVGGHLLSSLATNVASKAFTAALVPYFGCVADDAASRAADPLTKKAAIVGLACLAEGNPSYLRRRVGYVLDITRRMLADLSPIPREAAGFSLSYFCTHLQPEILTHHAELFPMLTPLLLDESDLVRRRVAEALDTLCENVEDNLEPYIDVLLPSVMESISRSSLETQKGLCGVISAMGMTRCESFQAHAPAVLGLLRQPFEMPASPESIPLRAQATETVGVVGAALGRELFAPYLPFFMGHVVENLRTTSASLREQSFGFLANTCEILQEGFLPYLDDSIACALQSVEEDKAVYSNKHLLAGADIALSTAAMKDDSAGADESKNNHGEEGDDDEDGGDEAEEIHLRVRTADVEEKASAVYSIGVFADVLRGHFGPERVAQCWEPLASLDEHYYPNIRANALVAAAKLLKASHGSTDVVKSLESDTLAERTRDLLDDLVNQTLLQTLRKETDRSVVAAACEAIGIVLDFFGPQAFPFGVDDLVRDAMQLLRRKMPCQLMQDDNEYDPEDSGDDGEGGANDGGADPVGQLLTAGDGAITSSIMSAYMSGAAPPSADEIAAAMDWKTKVTPAMVVQYVNLPDDHDEDVTPAVAEMIESLAKAYGPALELYAKYLFPLVALYADCETRPSEDVVMATGTIAIMLDSLGPACESFFDPAIDLSFAVIAASEESAARANSCYLIRVLIEHCTARFADTTAVQQILQALWSVVGNGSAAAARGDVAVDGEGYEMPQAVDNAISATCSLVRCLPEEMLPLDTIIPPMLSGIPMRIDKAENHNACMTLIHLLTAKAQTCAHAAWLPTLVGSVANVLASRTVEMADKQALTSSGVAPFVGQYAAPWQQARTTLSAQQQHVLQESGY